MRRRSFLTGLAGLGLASKGFAPAALAQGTDWPTRPIRLVVGFAAGGATDIVARIIATALSGQLGQSVVVENRPGAGGNIAAETVAKADPDGYTLLVATPSLVVNPSIFSKLPFDPDKSFVPISLVCSILDVLTVASSKPWKSLAELLADARARPGVISFASSGIGSGSHVSLVLLQSLAGINVLHVPYKGGGALIADFIAGRVGASIGTGPVLVPLVKDGRMRALGVATAKRSPLLPDVPAIGEIVAGYDVSNWIGLLAPAGTPAAVIEKVNAAAHAGLGDPEVSAKLVQQAAALSLMGPTQFDAFLKQETQRWAKVLKTMNVKVD
jgi:tripartite-type tricarboxylate transporter receptor subunit TctC